MESFNTFNCQYLKNNTVDDEIISKKNKEATDLIEQADLDLKTLNEISFDGKILFEKSNKDICNTILGYITTQPLTKITRSIVN